MNNNNQKNAERIAREVLRTFFGDPEGFKDMQGRVQPEFWLLKRQK